MTDREAILVATIRNAQGRVAKHIASLEWPETQEKVGWYVALKHDWEVLESALEVLVARFEGPIVNP
jgi:hypothetical protein